MRNTLELNKVHSSILPKLQGFQAAAVSRVQALVANHDVVVVGMAINPFPGRARRLLEEQGIAYEYVGFGSYLSQWRTRLGLKLWSGWPTFPMIFVKGTLIGGFDDLRRLLQSGELATLLTADRAIRAGGHEMRSAG